MDLVTLDQAKAQIRVTSTDEDGDIEMKLADAEAIVLDYLKDRADDTWTDETVPGPVRAAILRQFAALYQFRGDHPDDQGVTADNDGLAAGVKGLLMRMRDPAVA
jgi:hypothetical protein